ncbi:unnamed protein product [Brassica oleracea var. botrytis]
MCVSSNASFRTTTKASLWVSFLFSHIYHSTCFNYFRLSVYCRKFLRL